MSFQVINEVSLVQESEVSEKTLLGSETVKEAVNVLLKGKRPAATSDKAKLKIEPKPKVPK